MRRVVVLVGVLLAVVVLPSCSSGEEKAAVRLDGTARFPDDEGVATSLDRKSITLDGKRRYEVSDDLRSFSTYTRELEPLIARRGQYVQIGVDDGKMVWMAGIARVIAVEEEPAVFYTGRFREVAKGRLVFTDGTTFARLPSVPLPGTAKAVTVRVDPASHRIVEIT